MKIDNFDVLKVMADRNLNVKAFPSSNITYINVGKEFGRVTMKIDKDTAYKLINGKPIVFCLIVADADEFDEVKDELENAE